MLSPCLLFSFQPRSFLSPPEKGNHSLGSSTMERALVFAFHFQQLGATGRETSSYHVWLTKRCLVKAGVCLVLSTSQQSWPGTEANPC